MDLLSDAIPDFIDAVSVGKALEDAITPDHYKVEVVLDFEGFYVRLADYNVRISAVLGSLCFNIPERLGHAEPARKDSQWPLNIHVFLTRSTSFSESLRSVNLTSSCLNPDFLEFVLRLVVS